MNIILCGLPMSGKTTLGKRLAEKLDWNFIDTDRLIESAYAAKTGKISSCRQIYLQEGEESFRKLEKQQIASLDVLENSIIAVGGGALNDPENTKALKAAGCLIYLKTPVTILWERILRHGIPAYLNLETAVQDNKTTFDALAKKRTPLYEKAAAVIIETENLSEQEVVAAILNNRNISYGK